MSLMGITDNNSNFGAAQQSFTQQIPDLSGRGVGTTASQNAILNPSLAGTYAQQGNTRTFGGGLATPPQFSFPSLSTPAGSDQPPTQAPAIPAGPAPATPATASASIAPPATQGTPTPFSADMTKQVGALFGGTVNVTPEIMTQLSQLFGGGQQTQQQTSPVGPSIAPPTTTPAQGQFGSPLGQGGLGGGLFGQFAARQAAFDQNPDVYQGYGALTEKQFMNQEELSRSGGLYSPAGEQLLGSSHSPPKSYYTPEKLQQMWQAYQTGNRQDRYADAVARSNEIRASRGLSPFQ